MNIASYPKVYAIGHNAVLDVFFDEVHVEEKVDGSQFSFCKTESGEIIFKSKNCQVYDGYNHMFQRGIDSVKTIANALTTGYTYRVEYLAKPKHNTLCYDRTPNKNIILFDVNTGLETYMSYDEKVIEAKKLNIEVVPCFYRGKVDSLGQLMSFLDKTSILGGSKIEGFVVKNYKRFTPDGKAMIAKFVSERFKEINKKAFKERNPNGNDITVKLINALRTEARWDKAIQHGRDDGLLDNSPKDIGILLPSIINDVKEECEDYIKEILFTHFWKNISRGLIKGFPEYYKELLAKRAFEDKKEV